MRSSYDYAVIRLVPRVEREEFLNVGVILFCRTRNYLGIACSLDAGRLAAFAPGVDQSEVEAHLRNIAWICHGHPSAGPIARLTRAERFHWLTAPRSTIIQPSPVHSGLTDEPPQTLDHLLGALVSPPKDV